MIPKCLFIAVFLHIPMLFAVHPAMARQVPPATDIFVGNISFVDGWHQLSEVKNLTLRKGYDNQPSFSRDGQQMLYSSMMEGITDIFRHDFETGENIRVTNTPVSEYSPMWMPGDEGYSAVVVEEDGRQRLWKYSPAGIPVMPLLDRIEAVGYYSWLDTTRAALFVLGEPPVLRIADIRDGLSRMAAVDISRSLQTMPGSSKVAFIDKKDPGDWVIRSYDPDTMQTESLITTVPDAEDFAWSPYGTLLMARLSVIYEWDPLGGQGWTKMADLSAFGVRNITRLAVSPAGNRIAIVADAL